MHIDLSQISQFRFNFRFQYNSLIVVLKDQCIGL